MTTISSRAVLIDGEFRPATIRFEDGVIVEVADHTSGDQDYGDLNVLPGLVDTHVHVNQPGRTDWEGFATATAAALAGGSTTIVDMPLNSIPPTISVAALEVKRASASGEISCDVAFWGGIVPGSESEVKGLVAEGVCGFKVFLTDSGVPEFPPVDMATITDLHLDVPLLVHAEWPALIGESGSDYPSYLASRPPEAEAEAIRRLSELGGPVHILHVSSGDGVDAIAAGPSSMTGETCPHYLTFVDADVTGTEFKCAPPIRNEEHRAALWEALQMGTLGMVVSDHSPSPSTLKEGDFASAWGGVASVQLRLPATWHGAATRDIGLESVTHWLSAAPAALAGLGRTKGSIEVGKDADFAVFDPDGATTVSAETLLQRHPST
ncbi:MAG TPA: allantoinase AllB, partial [Acidimicrobiia bacterium]|nr:allantoinase AllB [Acidimicrobiia bacterium]